MNTTSRAFDAAMTVLDTCDMATSVAQHPDDQENLLESLALLVAGTALPNVRRVGVGDEALGLAQRGMQRNVLQPQSASREVILERVSTYEQARNKAFSILGTLGPDSHPYPCALPSSSAYGKVVGRESADGKARWRLDWDETKGTSCD